jgi:hypothetical protein
MFSESPNDVRQAGRQSMWSRPTLLKLIVAAALVFALAYVAAYVFKLFSPNRGNVKFNEAQRLFDAIPTYPDSQEVSTSGASKSSIAGVGKTYKSHASCEQLRSFYMDAVSRLGWQYVKESQTYDYFIDVGGRELTFQNGEYELVVQCAGDKADYGWDYAIDVHWYAG